MMNKVYLGIDIGGTAAKFGLVDENGNILHKDEFSVSFDGYETPIRSILWLQADLLSLKYQE